LSSVPSDPKERAQRDFLRSFFHDLATPLSAVSLHLEGASRRISRGEDPGESLNVARSELGRAFDLFERARDLLLVRPAGDAETFSFDEWVSSSLADFAGDGVEIRGSTGGRITADRAAVREALTSLVSNAIQYRSRGDVMIFCERAGDRLAVRIENAGALPSDDSEKLFAPRSAAPGKNWGMGLALARLYAAGAGGDIRLAQAGGKVSAILSFPEERA
jgi:signal transduction histidine kinase